MAPANEYLSDTTIPSLVAHDPRLVKKTTIETYTDDAPEVHQDFVRSVEEKSLSGYLDRFAEPDFADGKVTLTGAAEHVYGAQAVAVIPPEPLAPDYLLKRTLGFLQPASEFNKKHAVNGLVYTANPADGKIRRGDREALSLDVLNEALDMSDDRLHKVAETLARKIEVRQKKAIKINPAGRAQLEALRQERQALTRETLWDKRDDS